MLSGAPREWHGRLFKEVERACEAVPAITGERGQRLIAVYPAHVHNGPVEQRWKQWRAAFKGPMGTPYEGGIFEVELRLRETWPMIGEQQFRFITPIFHPNIDDNGMSCLEMRPYAMYNFFASIWQMLLEPRNTIPAVETEAGTLFKTDPRQFEEKARAYTAKHALPKGPLCVFDDAQQQSKMARGMVRELRRRLVDEPDLLDADGQRVTEISKYEAEVAAKYEAEVLDPKKLILGAHATPPHSPHK